MTICSEGLKLNHEDLKMRRSVEVVDLKATHHIQISVVDLADWELTVLEIGRGESALNAIYAANSNNDPTHAPKYDQSDLHNF